MHVRKESNRQENLVEYYIMISIDKTYLCSLAFTSLNRVPGELALEPSLDPTWCSATGSERSSSVVKQSGVAVEPVSLLLRAPRND